MCFCSPAQRKCRHGYIKLIYFRFLPRLVECSPQIIYDIGTQIIHFQCFVTTDMFLFCKPNFFSGNCCIFRDLLLAVSKHDLKPSGTFFLKICMRPWIRRYRFYWTFAPGGRLNYEAYNVDTKTQSLKTIQQTTKTTKKH